MTSLLTNPQVHSMIARNARELIKLGGLAALTVFSSNVFKTTSNNFIKRVTSDYVIAKEIINNSRPY